MEPQNWLFNEFQQTGVDYSQSDEVRQYDDEHSEFRDFTAENERTLKALELEVGDRVIEIGTGTGEFAIMAAQQGADILACDVSKAMLERTRTKAQDADIESIELRHEGFLTLDEPEESAEAIVTSYALHHLPDLWKGIALENLHRILRPGGQLFIRDVVLQASTPRQDIEQFIDSQRSIGGEQLQKDAEIHFREEYSTYDWILERLLSRAGFTVSNKSFDREILAEYLSVKTNE